MMWLHDPQGLGGYPPGCPQDPRWPVPGSTRFFAAGVWISGVPDVTEKLFAPRVPTTAEPCRPGGRARVTAGAGLACGLDRLRLVAVLLPGHAGEDLGDLGHRERLGTREGLGAARVRLRVQQDRHDGVGDVGPGHRGHAAVPGGSAQHTVPIRKQGQDVQVEVVPQEGVLQSGALDRLPRGVRGLRTSSRC